jgi:hypothetical protein
MAASIASCLAAQYRSTDPFASLRAILNEPAVGNASFGNVPTALLLPPASASRERRHDWPNRTQHGATQRSRRPPRPCSPSLGDCLPQEPEGGTFGVLHALQAVYNVLIYFAMKQHSSSRHHGSITTATQAVSITRVTFYGNIGPPIISP